MASSAWRSRSAKLPRALSMRRSLTRCMPLLAPAQGEAGQIRSALAGATVGRATDPCGWWSRVPRSTRGGSRWQDAAGAARHRGAGRDQADVAPGYLAAPSVSRRADREISTAQGEGVGIRRSGELLPLPGRVPGGEPLRIGTGISQALVLSPEPGCPARSPGSVSARTTSTWPRSSPPPSLVA
jgi:hypothetical protein